MAILVTPDLTTISLCEATTGWSSGSTDTANALQGTYCMGIQVKGTTGSVIKYDMGSGGTNFTGKHLVIWLKVNGTTDTQANGGLRVYVEDTSGNWKEFYVGGPESTSMGWTPYVVDPAATPTPGSSSGTLNVTLIRYVGCRFKVLSTVVGTSLNCFWDAVRYGTGLTITSGSTDAIDMEDVFAADNADAAKYGIVTKSFGSYIIQGLLKFGSTGSLHVDFADTNQVYVFPTNPFVSTSYYGFLVQCGTGTTNFQLGTKSGSSGISGCVIKAASTTRTFSFDASDSDNDKVLLYGCTFINAGIMTLPASASNREMLNCNIIACGRMVVSTCIVKYCSFISPTAAAVLVSSTSHQVSNCSFIAATYGMEFDTAGTYTIDTITFTGCTYDIYYTAASGNIIINATTSNASTYYKTGSGTVTINNVVDISVYVNDVDGNNVAANVAVYKTSDMTEIMNEATVDGLAEATYNYPGTDVPITIRVRKSSTGSTRYFPINTSGMIYSTGHASTQVVIVDNIASG